MNRKSAIETVRLAASLLSIPCEIVDSGEMAEFTFSVTAVKKERFRVIGTSVFSVENISNPNKPLVVKMAESEDELSAITSTVFFAVNSVVSMAMEKSDTEFDLPPVGVPETKEHKVFCRTCEQLVAPSEYGEKACKACEAQL